MKLYKYRPLGKYTENMLINAEIYLSQPKDFNDPFDSRSNTIYQGSYDNWVKYLKNNGLSDDEANKLALAMGDRTIKIDELDSRAIDKELNAICCFSEINDSILMWSHYANSHKGICIEYTTVEDSTGIAIPLDDSLSQIDDPVLNRFLVLKNVIYQNDMPSTYNRLKDDYSKLIQFIRTKHSNWCYEKEWRIIFVHTLLKLNPIKIKRSCITGVIFGMDINEAEKDMYINICKKSFIDNGFDLKLYQCKENPDKYAVDVNEI